MIPAGMLFGRWRIHKPSAHLHGTLDRVYIFHVTYRQSFFKPVLLDSFHWTKHVDLGGIFISLVLDLIPTLIPRCIP